MNSNGFFLLIALFLTSLVGLNLSLAEDSVKPNTATTQEVTDIFFLCKNDKAVRWLRAYKLDNGKCHTTYSKEGYLQVISSATYFSSCEGVLHNVRKNIEEGGYKCARVDKYSYLDLE